MAQYVARIGPKFNTPFRKLAYNLAGFRKYGLHYQDCYQDSPVLTEALKRLPPDVMDARNNRILRATYLSLNKTYLPKEEWTKYEEDIKYLQPYLEEVEREFSEKKAYNDNNFETK